MVPAVGSPAPGGKILFRKKPGKYAEAAVAMRRNAFRIPSPDAALNGQALHISARQHPDTHYITLYISNLIVHKYMHDPERIRLQPGYGTIRKGHTPNKYVHIIFT